MGKLFISSDNISWREQPDHRTRQQKPPPISTSLAQHLAGTVGLAGSLDKAFLHPHGQRTARCQSSCLVVGKGCRSQPAARNHFDLVNSSATDRPTRKLKQVTSYLKQQSKHFISIKHVVLVSQWNDEKTFKKTKKSL